MMVLNGQLYARVSDVLKPLANFDGIDPEVLKKKAIVGTDVHAAIHEFIQSGIMTDLVKGNGYLASFKKWWDTISPTCIETEKRYCCNYRMLTGCIDALIKLHGKDETVLVDFKTSVQESPLWVLQAHLYYYLIQQNMQSAYQPISPRFLFIKLDKYGKNPQVFEYLFSADTYKRCLALVQDFWNLQNVDIIP